MAVKVCSCGFANAEDANVCLACGAQLSEGASVAVSEAESSTAAPVLKLEFVSGSNQPIEIAAPGGIIGRAGNFSPEVFSSRISRKHAKLTFENNAWSITHLGRNKSYLLRGGIWTELPLGHAFALLNGDMLRFSDILFRVALASSNSEEAQNANSATAEGGAHAAGVQPEGAESSVGVQPEGTGQALSGSNSCGSAGAISSSLHGAENEEKQAAKKQAAKWVVVCPVCGARYEVASEQDRINECTTCIDTLDKRRIALVSPVQTHSAS
jgi:hypothetical protein